MLRARLAIAPLARQPVWGWKDPRNSLTLPFWNALLPDLKVLVCLRHPQEVARSMRERLHTPRDNGLALWTIYNRRLLEAVSREQRLVIAYSALLREPASELARVLAFIGLPKERVTLPDLADLIRPELERQPLETDPLPAGEIEALYRQLCSEACSPHPGTA